MTGECSGPFIAGGRRLEIDETAAAKIGREPGAFCRWQIAANGLLGVSGLGVRFGVSFARPLPSPGLTATTSARATHTSPFHAAHPHPTASTILVQFSGLVYSSCVVCRAGVAIASGAAASRDRREDCLEGEQTSDEHAGIPSAASPTSWRLDEKAVIRVCKGRLGS